MRVFIHGFPGVACDLKNEVSINGRIKFYRKARGEFRMDYVPTKFFYQEMPGVAERHEFTCRIEKHDN